MEYSRLKYPAGTKVLYLWRCKFNNVPNLLYVELSLQQLSYA
jgi:hypothetical protein